MRSAPAFTPRTGASPSCRRSNARVVEALPAWLRARSGIAARPPAGEADVQSASKARAAANGTDMSIFAGSIFCQPARNRGPSDVRVLLRGRRALLQRFDLDAQRRRSANATPLDGTRVHDRRHDSRRAASSTMPPKRHDAPHRCDLLALLLIGCAPTPAAAQAGVQRRPWLCRSKIRRPSSQAVSGWAKARPCC